MRGSMVRTGFLLLAVVVITALSCARAAPPQPTLTAGWRDPSPHAARMVTTFLAEPESARR